MTATTEDNDWLHLDDMLSLPSRPWRWHMAACGIDVPPDAAESEGYAAACNLRQLILAHWDATGQQEYILIEQPNMHSTAAVSASRTIPDLNAVGGITRVIPRGVWPLVADIDNQYDGQMSLL